MTLHLTEVKLCVLELQINTRPQLTFLHPRCPVSWAGDWPTEKKRAPFGAR